MSARSIHTKLIGFTVGSMAAIIVFLAWYFPSRQVEALDRATYERADMYGQLLANALRSAVAFADRATAEEVLSSLAVDDDVVASSLLGDDGRVLYHRGDPRQTRSREHPRHGHDISNPPSSGRAR